MSRKSAKIAALIEGCQGRAWPANYLGYFACFNRGLFFEAHDVLEELWLAQRGGSNHGFHKGLIQFAGAFVHLQKNRLRPAVALFRLSQRYLGAYGPRHDGLDVAHMLALADEWVARIEAADYRENPLGRHEPPVLSVE